MRRLKIDRRCDATFQSVAPSSHAQAPSVSGFQTRESPLRMRSDKVIAIEHGEIEEIPRGLHANRVQPGVLRPGATESVPVKAG